MLFLLNNLSPSDHVVILFVIFLLDVVALDLSAGLGRGEVFLVLGEVSGWHWIPEGGGEAVEGGLLKIRS